MKMNKKMKKNKCKDLPGKVKVARTLLDKYRGFMFRPEPESCSAIIFVEKKPIKWSMWTLGTAFPLQVIFTDDSFIAKEVWVLNPGEDCKSHSEYKYAIEMASCREVKVGDDCSELKKLLKPSE